MFKNGMRPIHLGEVLQEDYIKPMGISVRALSLALHVPYSRLRGGAAGSRRSPMTAITFGRDRLDDWPTIATAASVSIAKITADVIFDSF